MSTALLHEVAGRSERSCTWLTTRAAGELTATASARARPRRRGRGGVLARAAERTGGELHGQSRFFRASSIARAFRTIFNDFRQSYVLRYSPEGVPARGWHPIVVRAPPPAARPSVRARATTRTERSSAIALQDGIQRISEELPANAIGRALNAKARKLVEVPSKIGDGDHAMRVHIDHLDRTFTDRHPSSCARRLKDGSQSLAASGAARSRSLAISIFGISLLPRLDPNGGHSSPLGMEVEMKACRFVIALVALGPTAVAGVGSAQPEETLTNEHIVKMVRAQLSVTIIRSTIEASNVKFDLSPAALIALKDSGVVDDVILAMQARTRVLAKGRRPPPQPGRVRRNRSSWRRRRIPTSFWRNFRTMFVDASRAAYFGTAQMKAALGENKAFQSLKVSIVDDPAVADVVLTVNYTFAWDYLFVLKHQNTSVVLLSGKGVGPFSGPAGANSVAAELAKASIASPPEIAGRLYLLRPAVASHARPDEIIASVGAGRNVGGVSDRQGHASSPAG